MYSLAVSHAATTEAVCARASGASFGIAKSCKQLVLIAALSSPSAVNFRNDLGKSQTYAL